VSAAVNVLVSNLNKASNPQIVQSYANHQLERVQTLVNNVSKYAYLLILLFALPMIFHMDYILYLWLGDKVPEYAASFSIWTIVQVMITSLASPMDTAVFATGKIRNYQIILSLIILSNVVLTYILFSFGFNPTYAMAVKCFIEVFVLIVRVVYLRTHLEFSLQTFMRTSVMPVGCITCLLVSYLYLISRYVHIQADFINLMVTILLYIPVYGILVGWIALDRTTRFKLKHLVLSKIIG
jgi:O-antigen/teichoic acid export membrane protein